ncbi:YebW family protein [Klebsiella pneumoniae]|nr:YebW family protein [Klebsiella pneumoniae]
MLGVYDTENDCKAAAEEQHVKAECYPLKGLLDEDPAGVTVQM